MSRKALVLVLALVAVVLAWPVAGAAAHGVGGDTLAGLTPGEDTPGNGADDAPPDAPGLEVAEQKRSDGDDEGGQPLTVGIVDGTLGPGETVTIEVSQGGETAENVTVEVNEEPVGATDANGTLTLALPGEDKTKVKIEKGEAETGLEFEFEGGEQENEEDEDEGEDEGDEEDEESEDEEDEEDEDEGEDEEDEEDEDEEDGDEGDGKNEEDDGEDDEDGEDHPGGGNGPF